MSEQQLQEVMRRAQQDEPFSRQLFRDLEGTLKVNNYSLEPQEIARLRGGFASGSGPRLDPRINNFLETFQNQSKANVEHSAARMRQLGGYTADMFQKTLDYSARTYRKITLMNEVMFVMGVALFLFAALYGAFTHNLVYTGIFCGLGAASFISLFFLGPIEKTQAALSSLIQAEIAFLHYFEQVTLAEAYAQLTPPNSGKPTHDCIERASEMLQKRSRETIQLLQIYVGSDHKLLAQVLAGQKAAEKAALAGAEKGALAGATKPLPGDIAQARAAG